jgi:hypothetical protein
MRSTVIQKNKPAESRDVLLALLPDVHPNIPVDRSTCWS